MTVSEQVWGLCYDLWHSGERPLTAEEARDLAKGVRAMAEEIDRLRARLRLVGIALTLLAIAGAAVLVQ